MADLIKFRDELAEYAEKHGGLPNVVLSQSTDVGQAFSCISGIDNQGDNESVRDVTSRYVNEFCNVLNSEEYKGTLDVFDRTVKSFSDKIKDAMASLDGIRTSARELAASAETLVNNILNNNEFYTKYQRYSEMSTDFPMFDWNAVKVWGTPEALATAVNKLVTASGVDPSDQIDARLFNIVVSGIDRFVKYDPVALDEETRTAVIDQLKTLLPDTASDKIEKSLDLVVGLIHRPDIQNIVVNYRTNPPADIFNNIRTIDEFVQDNHEVIEAVASQQVKADESVQEALVTAGVKLQNLLKILAYYEQMMRTTMYRDSYLLPRGLLNGDQQATFTAAGGTPQMIANYIRKLYKDDYSLIPVMGIKADTIVNADSTVADEVNEMNKVVADKVALLRINARVSAFKVTAASYVGKQYDVNHPDEAVDPAKRSVYVNQIMMTVGKRVIDAIRQYNICFVEAFITLVTGTNYANTFVEFLQQQLGAAYLSLTNLNSEITDDDIRCAEAEVIAKLVVNFVVDKMTCVSAPVTKSEIKDKPDVRPAQEG